MGAIRCRGLLTIGLAAVWGISPPTHANASDDLAALCRSYGAGFSYVEGTGTCLKVGGLARVDVNVNADVGLRPYVVGRGRPSRANDYTAVEKWFSLSFDARSDTQYGTLRAYIRAVLRDSAPNATDYGEGVFDRAFIQLGGLTFGAAQSFFAFYADALNYAVLLGGGKHGEPVTLIAHTQELWPGTSITLSVEDTAHSANIFSTFGVSRIENGLPDFIAAIRGQTELTAFQLMAALHEVKWRPRQFWVVPDRVEKHIGFALGGGLKVNLAWSRGDEVWLQAIYSRGANQYLGFNSPERSPTTVNSLSVIPNVADAFQDPDTGRATLVSGWTLTAAFQHFWTPLLRTALFGQYGRLDYKDFRFLPGISSSHARLSRQTAIRASQYGNLAYATSGRQCLNSRSEWSCSIRGTNRSRPVNM